MFDLVLVVLFSSLQLLFVWSGTHGFVRVVSGFMFLAVWPGYSLLALVSGFRRQEQSLLEHVAVAVPVSLALATILGLVINALDITSSPQVQASCIAVLIYAFSFSAIVVRRRSGRDGEPDRLQFATLMGSLFAAAVVLGLLASGLKSEQANDEHFASLYVLDAKGQLVGSPLTAEVGIPLVFTVGGEYEGPVTDDVLLSSSTGERLQITLEPNSEWERQVEIVLTEPGEQVISWQLASSSGGFERNVQLRVTAR